MKTITTTIIIATLALAGTHAGPVPFESSPESPPLQRRDTIFCDVAAPDICYKGQCVNLRYIPPSSGYYECAYVWDCNCQPIDGRK